MNDHIPESFKSSVPWNYFNDKFWVLSIGRMHFVRVGGGGGEGMRQNFGEDVWPTAENLDQMTWYRKSSIKAPPPL